MTTPRYERFEVTLYYPRRELDRMFDRAHELDVSRGGIYDGRSAAINVWTHRWTTEEDARQSLLACSFYFNWTSEELWQIEVSEGFTLEQAYQYLMGLEIQALGIVVWGRTPQRPDQPSQ